MSHLNWKLLLKKRPGVTQGLPAGQEDLAWVTNTVTLIYGKRDAVLVDTFLSVQRHEPLAAYLLVAFREIRVRIVVNSIPGDYEPD